MTPRFGVGARPNGQGTTTPWPTARPRTASLWLPDRDGGVEAVAPLTSVVGL